MENSESCLKIAIIYFSATDVTDTYAQKMKESFRSRDHDVDLINKTSFSARQQALDLEKYDAFVFGFPVFSDFAPTVMNAWITTLDGKGKRCGMFFTYGGRTTGYAHFHTKTLLEGAGFTVVLSGEFLGRHSYNVGGWKALPNRPDAQDFEVVKEYVDLFVERLVQQPEPNFVLQKPFGYRNALQVLEKLPGTTRGWRHPVRVTEDCAMCRLCEEECPTQAFNADSGLSDPEKCIMCMRCVYVCPDKVLKIDKRMEADYERWLRSWNLNEAMLNAKKSKIISEFWQAVC